MEKASHANQNEKRAAVAIHVSDKTDLKKDCNKRQIKMLHNNQEINSRRRHNNCKHMCINTRIPVNKYIKQVLPDVKEGMMVTSIVGSLKLHLHQLTNHQDRISVRKHWPSMTH